MEEAEEAEALSKKEGALDEAVSVEEGLSSASSSTAAKEGGSSSHSSLSSSSITVVVEEDDKASSYSTRLIEEVRLSSFSDSFLLKLTDAETLHSI